MCVTYVSRVRPVCVTCASRVRHVYTRAVHADREAGVSQPRQRTPWARKPTMPDIIPSPYPFC